MRTFAYKGGRGLIFTNFAHTYYVNDPFGMYANRSTMIGSLFKKMFTTVAV